MVNYAEVAAVVIYFVAMVAIGVYFFVKSKNSTGVRG